MDFFFDENRYYGNVLIYGVSFSESGINQIESLPAEIREKSVQYYNCLDGHIIKRLCSLQKTGRIERITIAAYDESEVPRYKRLIDVSGLEAEIEVGCPLAYYCS